MPRDPHTGQPIGPLAQPGYYPGFSTLAQRAFWDEATRRLVLDRVEHEPPIRFFTADEARTLEVVCERVIPQDDRDAAHKIPIVPRIDDRLANGAGDGYRYEDMPPDGEAYRLGIAAIDAMARVLHDGRHFVALAPPEQEALLRQLHDGAPQAAHEHWRKLPVRRFWLLLVGDCAAAYYAHPYAWDEIGFGGPAYPRGYMRLEHGEPEPWEVRERRYEWVAPPWSVSDQYAPLGGEFAAGAPGQEGTH